MTIRGTPAQDGGFNEWQSNYCNPPSLEVAYAHTPNRDAMLQALRVVLGLPVMPIALYDENKRREAESLYYINQSKRPNNLLFLQNRAFMHLDRTDANGGQEGQQ